MNLSIFNKEITTTAIIGTNLRVEEYHHFSEETKTVWTEKRPASLADADTALAFHGLGRTGAWDLGPNGSLVAPVAKIQNTFNGTPAARLWEAVGTTHEEWVPAQARTVRNGDLITDMEFCAPYVVAGSDTCGEWTKLIQVGEGKTWADRYAGEFGSDQFVMVARRKA